MSNIDPSRVRKLNDVPVQKGAVVYWMSRDQRVEDNWALLYAEEQSRELGSPLIVVFTLAPSFLDATLRHYDFMINGLREIEKELDELNISFVVLLNNDPVEALADFCVNYGVGSVVTDFSPMRIGREWRERLAQKQQIAVCEVDAHNIVPVWIASNKKEFAARTIRPKLKALAPAFLKSLPVMEKQNHEFNTAFDRVNWDLVYSSISVDTSVKPVDWLRPGAKSAEKSLTEFIDTKLEKYDFARNDPNEDAQSNLSPYLHFGQISAQRVALEVSRASVSQGAKDVFLEELIVRRELADNFCFYERSYDSFEGFADWAQKTLNDHRIDTREHTYTLDQFEQAVTHDELWNAAQQEMIKSGKMHGYMRMYWAKKILEWTRSPEDAMTIAVYLNDRYSLDGRDPNGYTGVAWSIGGVHDRPWFDRPVFGKVRYMNYNGAKKKFNVESYIQSVVKL